MTAVRWAEFPISWRLREQPLHYLGGRFPMSGQIRFRLGLFLVLLTGGLALTGVYADEKAKPSQDGASPGLRVQPKALSEQVEKGLEYLVNQQQANGGWGQGGGWRSSRQGGGRVEGANVQDPADVADTCMAALALFRAGNTPKQGKYAKNLARAVDFICSHVDRADKDSLFVTDVRDTQVQVKIGPYVDTFLASLVLAELKGKMPSQESDKRLVAALAKTVGKIEKNQKDDGTFAGNNGWASIFSQGLACKALNRARQSGFDVKEQALARAEGNALASLDRTSGTFKSPAAHGAVGVGGGIAGGRGSALSVGALGRPLSAERVAASMPTDAGVPVYFSSNNLAGLQESLNTAKAGEKRSRDILGDKKSSKKEKDRARSELERLGKLQDAQKSAVAGLAGQLNDKQFIQGFGSNGGEEFLSYLNISETLVVTGGAEWQKWDKSVTENLNRIQNQDGSWSGQHCITGRTICTAAALMVLMADRTPIPTTLQPDGKTSRKN
jgi:Prenyltransferase and squalene oxidase repeat